MISIRFIQKYIEFRDIIIEYFDEKKEFITFVTNLNYLDYNPEPITMISFTCDYNEGAHLEILRRLIESNMEQLPGYGEDIYTQSACEKIRCAVGDPDAQVILLTGGTQTNATIIDAMLMHHEAVIAASTGHIAVHEAGAVELHGHKVITIAAHDGKINPDDLRQHLSDFYADPTYKHMAQPAMVYISFPTEAGTIYKLDELKAIRHICDKYNLKLFIDGARLGFGLASPACDFTMRDLPQLCDAFYIGGTKVGALCGEAVVFPRGKAPRHFFSIVKQHGALMAKGRVLGIQFDTLFTDDLYMRISRHAIDMAKLLKQVFIERGIPLSVDSPTNQQFPILTAEQQRALEGKVEYEVWQTLPDGKAVTRFATSWATTHEQIEQLRDVLTNI